METINISRNVAINGMFGPLKSSQTSVGTKMKKNFL
jgi:hypothetical protein